MDTGDVLHILVKDLVGASISISLNHGDDDDEEDTAVIGTTTEVPTTTLPYSTILAGTFPLGLILESVNSGNTFVNKGSIEGGKVTCFCEMSNGDILYGMASGYLVNYTQSTSDPPSSDSITSIIEDVSAGKIYISDNIGDIYESPNDDIYSYTLPPTSIGSAVFSLIEGNGIVYSIGAGGIHDITIPLIPVQVGSFTAVVDAGSGVFYVSDDSNIAWESADYGATWVSTGSTIGASTVTHLVLANNGRIVAASGSSITYSDDGCATDFTSVAIIGIGTITALIYISGDRLLLGDDTGSIFESDDNGETWFEIAGNPQQGETFIGSLIKIS